MKTQTIKRLNLLLVLLLLIAIPLTATARSSSSSYHTVVSPITGANIYESGNTFQTYADEINSCGRMSGHSSYHDDYGAQYVTIDFVSGRSLSYKLEDLPASSFWNDLGGGDDNWSYDPPPPAPCDLTVTDIAPLTGYRGATTVTAVTINNNCTETRSGVLVELSAGGQTLAKSVTVRANSTATAYFRWTTPDTTTATVNAKVNPLSAITETDYTNNSLSAELTLGKLPDIPNVIEPTDVPARTIIDPIAGENVTNLTWTGTDPNTGEPKTYSASLTIKAAFDQTDMKSGYGFKCKARVTVTTDCPDNDAVLKAQQVVMYIPEYGYANAVRLESTDHVVWELPVNPTSHYGYRRWYVPVWFPDRPYTVVVQALGAMTPGGELKGACQVSLNISGNMYEDDVTYIEYSSWW